MADPITSNAPDDDLLTAFLDGELGAEERRTIEARLAAEPALKARFNSLAGSARPFAQAFAMVLDAAPAERLQATLAEIEPHAGPVAPRRVWMSAAAVLVFAVGIAVGVGTGNGPSPFAPRETVNAITALNASQSKVAPAQPAAVRAIPFGQNDAADASATVSAAPPPPPSGPVAMLAPAPSAQVSVSPPARPLPPNTDALARQVVPQPPAFMTEAPKATAEVQPQAFASAPAAPSPAPPVPRATANATPSGLAGIAAAAPSAADAQGTLQPPPSWRQVVVEYLVLTTPETLALLPENPRLSEAVAAYAGKLQLDMSAEKLTLPMAALKDVRLFDYRGRPLVEAAYLSDDAIAVAFCIILNGQADVPMGFEQREGENIVFWTKGGHGYMVAGKAPRERLEAIARDFAARFG